MASLTYKVVAKVPPDKAFQYVADIKRHAEWGMDDMKVDPVTGGPTKVGSRFNAVGHLLGKPNPSTVTVTAYEPPRRLAFDAEDKSTIFLHEFRFTPQNGGTLIERELTGKKRPVVQAILFPLFKGAIDKNFNGAMAKLKERLESGAP